MKKLLVTGRVPPALVARLALQYDLTDLLAQPNAEVFLANHGEAFVGVVTSAAMGVQTQHLARLPNVRVISSFGVGLDKIDVAAAAARGIVVGYTPDVLNDCVADIAMGLLIDTARGMSAADRHVRQGLWPQAPYKLTRKVSGAKLGIVGMGRIGRAIAKRSTGFDMTVKYHARNVVADVAWPHEPSLLTLAEWADFLVVITAGGAGTKHLINRDVLQALGPQGFLVNVSRGSVVDEAALIEALQSGGIAGAGLDVFANEPHVPSAFMGLDNVVLLPHVASGTQETRQAMADRVFDNLHGFFTSGQLVSQAPT